MKKLLLLSKVNIQKGIFSFFVLSLFFKSYAQPFNAAYSWSGTITCPASSGTVPTVTGLTFAQCTRGTVNCNSTSASFRSSNWPVGDSSSAVSGNKYITFSISANASASVAITSIVLRLFINSTNNGNGGPKNAKLKFTTASAYASCGDIISLSTTATNYTFTPSQTIILGAGQTITFRLYGYNSGSNGAGTLDVTAINVNGQTNLGQYKSKTSGNWNNVTAGSSSWETSPNGTTWTEALVAPNNNSGATTIQNGHTISVNSTIATDELVINSGGRLSINSGYTLTVANGTGIDLENNGILDVQGILSGLSGSCALGSEAELHTNNASGVDGVFTGFATVTFSASNNNSFIFNSSENQNTGMQMPSIVKNLTITNGGIKTLSKKTIIGPSGVLTLSGGTFDLNNDSLILQSNSSGTARVDRITGGGTFTNASKFTIQRYVPSANGRFWWHLCAPVSGASVAQWQDDFYVTGTFSNPSTAPGLTSTGGSLRYYDETVSGDLNSGWVNYPGSGNSSANPLIVAKGYRAFIRDNNVSSSDKTIDVTGTPNTGTQSFNLTRTGTDLINDGWNFIGNPYPSDIDWSNEGWSKTNVDNAVYVWNAASQSYSSFISGIGTNGGTGRIASSQAFWVKANGANPVLSATENVKTSTSTTFTKNSSTENLLRIALTNNNSSDEIVIRFDASASNGYDAELDAYSLSATNLGLASIGNEAVGLSINSLPDLTEDLIVNLNSYYSANGTFSLVFNSLETFTEDIEVYLIDNYLDSVILVTNGMFYDFDITTDADSKKKDRFAVSFNRNKVTSVWPVKSKPDFLVYPNPANEDYFNIRFINVNGSEVMIALYNVLGKEIVNEKISNSSVSQIKLDDHLPGGIYLIQCTINGQKYTRSLVIR